MIHSSRTMRDDRELRVVYAEQGASDCVPYQGESGRVAQSLSPLSGPLTHTFVQGR